MRRSGARMTGGFVVSALADAKGMRKPSFWRSLLDKTDDEAGLARLTRRICSDFRFSFRSERTNAFLRGLFLRFLQLDPSGDADGFLERIEKVGDVSESDGRVRIVYSYFTDGDYPHLTRNPAFRAFISEKGLGGAELLCVKDMSFFPDDAAAEGMTEKAKGLLEVLDEAEAKLDRIIRGKERKRLDEEAGRRRRLLERGFLDGNGLPDCDISSVRGCVSPNDYKYICQNLALYRPNPENLPASGKTLRYSRFVYFYGAGAVLDQVVDAYCSSLVRAGHSMRTVSSADLGRMGWFDRNRQFRQKGELVSSCMSADFLVIRDLDRITAFNIDLLHYIVSMRVRGGLPVIICESTSRFRIFSLLLSVIRKRSLYGLKSLIAAEFYSLEIHEREYRPFASPAKRLGNPYFYSAAKAWRRIGGTVGKCLSRKIGRSAIMDKVRKLVERTNARNSRKRLDLAEALNIAGEIIARSAAVSYHNKP